MKLKSLFNFILFLIICWSVICIIRPFWEKYQIGQEMEIAAIYGTKHDIEETRKFLSKKNIEHGWRSSKDIKDKDFIITKNEYNDATISLTYDDQIKIFGYTLKELELTIEKKAKSVKEF